VLAAGATVGAVLAQQTRKGRVARRFRDEEPKTVTERTRKDTCTKSMFFFHFTIYVNSIDFIIFIDAHRNRLWISYIWSSRGEGRGCGKMKSRDGLKKPDLKYHHL
jgi:hypothetical protein